MFWHGYHLPYSNRWLVRKASGIEMIASELKLRLSVEIETFRTGGSLRNYHWSSLSPIDTVEREIYNDMWAPKKLHPYEKALFSCVERGLLQGCTGFLRLTFRCISRVLSCRLGSNLLPRSFLGFRLGISKIFNLKNQILSRGINLNSLENGFWKL